MAFDYKMKVIMIGDSGSGKSSLTFRFTEDKFTFSNEMTIGIEFGVKTILTGQSNRVKIQVWDTAGQEMFRSITRSYYKGCTIAMVVYDVTSRRSFNNVSQWLEDIAKYATGDVVTVLVGNKTDKTRRSGSVTFEEGAEFASRNDMMFFETSAKDPGKAVHDMFARVSDEVCMRIETNEIDPLDPSWGITVSGAKRERLVMQMYGEAEMSGMGANNDGINSKKDKTFSSWCSFL